MRTLDDRDEFQHVVETAESFNESMYFNFFDPARRVGGFLRLGNRPNEGQAEMTACLFLPGTTGFMFRRPSIAGNERLDAGGLRFEVVTPWKELTVLYEGELALLSDPLVLRQPKKAFAESPRAPARIDLTLTATSPVYGGEAAGGQRAPEIVSDFARGHYEQHLGATGTVAVADNHWEITGFGLRDHSWGPRSWQAPWWYRWLTANFGPDFGFAISIVGSRRRPTVFKGVMQVDGLYQPVTGGQLRTEWVGDDRRPDGIAATITTPTASYDIVGTTLRLVPLRHRPATGGTSLTRITEGLTEWACFGRMGYGLAEYLDQIHDGQPVGSGEESAGGG